MKLGKKKAEIVEVIQQNAELATVEVVETEEISYGDSIVPVAVPKKKRRWGRIVALVLVGLLVLWLVISNVLAALRGPAPTLVQVYTAATGSVQQTITSTGTITAAEKVTLFSPVSAPISEINAELGGIVENGALLFSFDTVDLQRSYDVANAALRQSSLANEAATDASNKAAQEVKDAKASVDNLVYQQGIAKQRLDASSAALETASARLAALQASLAAAGGADPAIEAEIAEVSEEIGRHTVDISTHQADYAYQTELLAAMRGIVTANEAAVLDDNAKAQMQTGTVSPTIGRAQALEALEKGQAGVTAPMRGVVTALTYEPGAYASQYGALCVIESIDRVNVVVSLSRYDLENVRVGQEATVTTRGQTYTARVSKIDGMASASVSSNGTTSNSVAATLEILQPDENITLGLDANVSITTGTADNTLIVPVSALNTDVTGSFCYVVENGVAVRREVVMGLTGGSSIEIVSGLTTGDGVILCSQNIFEGQAVSPMSLA